MSSATYTKVNIELKFPNEAITSSVTNSVGYLYSRFIGLKDNQRTALIYV